MKLSLVAKGLLARSCDISMRDELRGIPENKRSFIPLATRLNDPSGRAPDRATSFLRRLAAFRGINSWACAEGRKTQEVQSINAVLTYLKMSHPHPPAPETQHKGVSVLDRVIELFG